jgi:hypothetical protein
LGSDSLESSKAWARSAAGPEAQDLAIYLINWLMPGNFPRRAT